jgi:SNF2 family DNA or RNA helicase
MPSGGWLRLTLNLTGEQEQAVGHLGLDVYDLSGETHRMHVLQLAEPKAGEIFDPDAWNRIADRASRLKLQVRPPVPPGFQLQLRPYQVEGFHFLAYLSSNTFGGILADDMGLGKTAQAICWMLWLRERASRDAAGESRNPPPTLVVAPKSVLDVWAGETQKFAPHLRVQVIREKTELDTSRLGRDIDLLVMNYSQLRVNADKLKPIDWLSVVLDEGQQIKNPDSIAARAARELKSPNRLVLSGTPIENRLLDVWSLMAFAMPGVLGNRKYFRDRFDRRKDAGAQVRLSARLRPFLLRRTKNQVALDLPGRTEEDILANLEEAQEELYTAELQKMQRLVLGLGSDAEVKQNSFAILQGLMRLRQICCHPGLADEQHMDKDSAKMNALFYLLDQLRESNHKVLVFSQFTSMLDIIKTRLMAEERPHLLLTGQTKDRGEVVRTFHTSKEPHVFLLSLKAGGTGLNLTAASYVVLYDPWWNPAVEQQAIDRTHRIGQTNPVIAYRLLARNTVEEKIRQLQFQKQQLVTGVLGDESFTSNLGLDEVRSLFQRDEDPPDELKKTRRIPRRTRHFATDGAF